VGLKKEEKWLLQDQRKCRPGFQNYSKREKKEKGYAKVTARRSKGWDSGKLWTPERVEKSNRREVQSGEVEVH